MREIPRQRQPAVPPAASPVAGDRPMLPPHLRRIDPNAVRQHLGAIDGLSQVGGLQAIVARALAPTADLLRRELERLSQ